MPYLDKKGRTCGFLNVEEKESSGRFSRRYFILTKDEKFQYYMDNPHNLPHNARSPIREISLQIISKVSDARKLRPKVDSCFVINYAGNVMYLQADDNEDMRKWVEALNNASKITVPKNEDRHSTESNEWHHKGVSEAAFTTDIAGGVVCKLPLRTSDDESSQSSEGEFDSHGVPANDLIAIKAGFCVKQGGMRKNWKRRYFVLNDQGLLYFQSEKAKEPLRTIPRQDIQEVKKTTKISSFSSRKKGIDEITLEMRGELTPFETQLLERQEVVVIRGKTGKGVPVILPSDVKKTLQFLADPDIREKAGIQPSNLYLFANRQIGVFRAYDAIRSISREGEAGLEMPELVRTSNMRKYMATMIQALDTTEAERQWVVDHLGHTMDIHRVHYRQTSDLPERVDVAKILLIQDMGLVGKYRGKKLQDIQLDDIMENDRVQEKTTNSSKSDAEKDDTSSNVPVDNDPTDASIDETYIPEIPSSDEEDEDNEPKPKRRKVKQAVRKQWSGDEVKEIEALFKDAFKKDACPGQKQIEKMMKISKEKSGFIHLRARDTIKKKISNMLIKRRKLSK